MPLMPARQYLTELRDAAAQSLEELPPTGPCPPATVDRILTRLEPYVGDTALGCCVFNADLGTLAQEIAEHIAGDRFAEAATLIDELADRVRDARDR